jgi:hypothetical protein
VKTPRDLIQVLELNAKVSLRGSPQTEMMPGLMIAMLLETHSKQETPMVQAPMKMVKRDLIQELELNAKVLPRRSPDTEMMPGSMTAKLEETHSLLEIQMVPVPGLMKRPTDRTQEWELSARDSHKRRNRAWLKMMLGLMIAMLIETHLLPETPTVLAPTKMSTKDLTQELELNAKVSPKRDL